MTRERADDEPCMAVLRAGVRRLVAGPCNGRQGIGGLGGGRDEKLRDAFNLVRKNVCRENAGAGIEIDVSQGRRIAENTCLDNSREAAGAWPGILIRNAEDLRVTGNICAGPEKTNQREGLRVVGGTSDIVLQDNRLEFP